MSSKEIHGSEWGISAASLVIWVVCLTIGLLGLALPYSRPNQRVNAPEPPVVQMLQMELQESPQPASNPETTTEPVLSMSEMTAPQPLPVAQLSPSVAFAVPVARPARTVMLQQAAYKTAYPPFPPAQQPPKPQTLTFGQGEGKQPAPDYPRRSIQERQEGVVGIRFVVGENGSVSSVEVLQPSAWPALNDAALRTIRDRWQFPSGKLRLYDIAIRFHLTN
jgi:protein TonB